MLGEVGPIVSGLREVLGGGDRLGAEQRYDLGTAGGDRRGELGHQVLRGPGRRRR
jgi:hypothetical protein